MYRRIQVSVHPVLLFPTVLLFVTKHILHFVPTQTPAGCALAIPVIMHVAQTILARSSTHLSCLVGSSILHKHQMCGACIAGNVHDTVCMRLFAAGLLATGLKDEAAGVYYSLLQEGADRAQQVACSDCSSLGVCIWQNTQTRAASEYRDSKRHKPFCTTVCLTFKCCFLPSCLALPHLGFGSDRP